MTGVVYSDGTAIDYGYNEIGSVTTMTDKTGTTTYQYDDMQRLIATTDSNDKTVEYEYDILGRRVGITLPDGQKTRRDEKTDSITGIQYLRARYYDTAISRFFQEDDYKGQYNRPSGMNRYVYVEGNPVSRTDSSGYFYYNGSGQQATQIKTELKSVGNAVSKFYTDCYTKKANTPTIIHNTAEYYQYVYGKQNQPTIINYIAKVMIKNPYPYGSDWVSEDIYNCMKDLDTRYCRQQSFLWYTRI